MYKKLIKISRAILIFIIIFSLFGLSAYYELNRSIENEKRIVRDNLLLTQNNLEGIITSRMISMSTLNLFIETNTNFTQEQYENFAKHIYNSTGNLVKGMFFITDTTITHAYPFDKEKSVIGVDLALVADQKDLLLYAKEQMKSVFTAPVNLVEGGVGIVVRVPVSSENKYFGQVAIIFDYDKVIQNSGIERLSEKYYIVLTTIDPFSGLKKIVWSNASQEIKQTVNQKVELYDSHMLLQMAPKEGWHVYSPMFFMLLITGIFVSSIASYGTFRTLNANDKLKQTNDELGTLVKRLVVSEQQLSSQYDEIVKKESTIQFLAEHDALTELLNRRKFVENLERYLDNGAIGAIVLLDLDNFKNINDSLGHVYGDKIIAQIARIIEKSVCEDTEVYRFGGDEFVILIPNKIEPSEINQCLNQMTHWMNQGIHLDDVKNHITASYGVSRYPMDGNNVLELMAKADIAMYHAKKNGKNQKHYYDESMSSEFDKRVHIEKKLHEAIENDGFMVYYQPIVSVETRKIVAFEALIRMKDFSLNPDVFIPVAEETLLILEIGNWVITEVLDQILRWKEKGLTTLPVAINFSPRQISDGKVVGFVREALKIRGLDASVIEIEITENVLMDNKNENIRILNELKEMGIKLALDDFGTGYSSLNYLTFLPVDVIKIDRSLKERFIDHENSKIIDSLVHIAHSLGFKVVIEGVETAGEYNKLLLKGCDFMQGYLFSRPIPSEHIDKFLVDTQINI